MTDSKFHPRKWVYVAGPYTRPDPVENTHNAIRVGDTLYAAGLFPYIPHLSLLQHMVVPHPVEHWYAYDLQAIVRCDALLRLPGESTGADAEVAFAHAHSIPVYDGPDAISDVVEALTSSDAIDRDCRSRAVRK